MSAACSSIKRAGDAAKSGEFLGEFSWVEFDPVGVEEGYSTRSTKQLYYNDSWMNVDTNILSDRSGPYDHITLIMYSYNGNPFSNHD